MLEISPRICCAPSCGSWAHIAEVSSLFSSVPLSAPVDIAWFNNFLELQWSLNVEITTYESHRSPPRKLRCLAVVWRSTNSRIFLGHQWIPTSLELDARCCCTDPASDKVSSIQWYLESSIRITIASGLCDGNNSLPGLHLQEQQPVMVGCASYNVFSWPEQLCNTVDNPSPTLWRCGVWPTMTL